MAKLFQRIGAKHIKFDLDVEVHYLKISLEEATLIKVRVKRGKDKVEETQPMQYSPKLKQVQFDYPLNFRITMYRKGKSYMKKDLEIKVLEIQGKNEIPIGKVKVEFQKIAETQKSIVGKELKLEECKDSLAKLCLSVSLTEEGSSKNQFLTGGVKPVMVPNRRAMSFAQPDLNSFGRFHNAGNSSQVIESDEWEDDFPEPKEGSQSLLESSNDESDDFVVKKSEIRERKASLKTVRSAFVVTQELLDEINNETGGHVPEIEEILDIEEKNQFEHEDYDEERNQIENFQNHRAQTVDARNLSLENVESDEEIIEKNNDRVNLSQTSPKKNSSQEGKNYVFIEKESTEKESLENNQTKETKNEEIKAPIVLPEYLKYLNEPVAPEDILSKDLADSSSEEEMPTQVDISEPEEKPFIPISNLKESVPNSLSQDEQITLKERDAGLPTSREATCCASCLIY